MNLPFRFWRTSSITKRIAELTTRQAAITKQLLDPMDAFTRSAIDFEERKVITELMELKAERFRRGRQLAEKNGLIPARREP